MRLQGEGPSLSLIHIWGTIATLLVTPMKRSHLAMGKIGALAIIALLSGLSSTLGTIL